MSNQAIKQAVQSDEHCQRLQSMDGVGPLIATALVAVVGVIPERSGTAGSSRLGWGWYRASTAGAANQRCWGPAKVGIVICAPC